MFVVGLGGSLAVCLLWAADSRTGGLALGGVGGVGMLCGVIAAATRSRLPGLVTGTAGLTLMILILGGGYETRWLPFFWVVFEIPYLVGFGIAMILAAFTVTEPSETP